MHTILEAAKRSCISILHAEANKEDGVQQTNQTLRLQDHKEISFKVQAFFYSIRIIHAV